MNPFITGLQNFAMGSSPASGMVNLGLSMFGQNPNQASDAAVSQGMQLLGGYMKANNNDPAKAMLQFVGSPEGKQIMRQPGAFKKLTDTFRSALTNPPPAATPATPGSVVTQNGQPYALQGNKGYTPPNPEQYTTAAGNRSDLLQPQAGGTATPAGTVNQPPNAFQNFKALQEQYCPNCDPQLLGKIAMGTISGSMDQTQKLMAVQQLVDNGILTKQQAPMWLSGAITAQPVQGIPFTWAIINTATGQVHVQRVLPQGAQGQQPQPNFGPSAPPGTRGSLVPGYITGNASEPETLHNSPNFAAPLINPQAGATVTPQMATVAKKYNVPADSIKPDGSIDPVKAYGASSIMALGAGLPAIMQNKEGIIDRWLTPGNRNETSDLISKAEIAGDGLSFLLTGLAAGNTRLHAMIQAVLEMGPEHEKWSDPQYATNQLVQLRQTLEGQANVNIAYLERAQSGDFGNPTDNKTSDDLIKQNIAIEKVLRFLPSTGALLSMKEAIRDGKVYAPSIGTAARTAGDLAAKSVGSLFAPGATVENINADPQGAIKRIGSATGKQLQSVLDEYPSLDPAIQRAIDGRIQQLRQEQQQRKAAPKGGRGPGEIGALGVRALGGKGNQTVQLRNGKQAIMAPPEGNSDFLPESQGAGQNGLTPFDQTMGTPRGRVNNAFSAIGQ